MKDQTVYGWMIAGVSFLAGLATGYRITERVTKTERDKHDATVIEQGKEIKRLRAQVAKWVGRE